MVLSDEERKRRKSEIDRRYRENPVNKEKLRLKAKERAKKNPEKNRERHREACKKYYKKNREEILEKQAKHYKKNRGSMLKVHKNWRDRNPDYYKERAKVPEIKEKNRLSAKKSREKDPERYKARMHAWYVKNREKAMEQSKQWAKDNPEFRKAIKKRSYEKNPVSATPEMTTYRRKHRKCEWFDCNETKSLHVHHILPQHKYPEFSNGNYHGRIGNNFISFCPLHHFMYHDTYATKRNDMKHRISLGLLWAQAKIQESRYKIT